MTVVSTNHIDWVICQAGDYHIGFEASQIASAQPYRKSDAESNQDIDLRTLIGMPKQRMTPVHKMRLIPDADLDLPAILIDSDISLQALGINTLYPLPSLLTARCQLNGLAGLVLQTTLPPIFVIDLSRLNT
jgi:hypothetical protein